MAMTKGSITVAIVGSAVVVSGSGFAKELYDDYAPKLDLDFTGIEDEDDALEAERAARQGIADLLESIALVITHIKTNGKARVKTSSAGLQRLPASLVEDEPTKAPASEQKLEIE